MPLLSYHNNPKVKEHYLARVRAHRDAGEIVKGVYWKNGKGCGVGCTIHSSDIAAYETKLGLPMWLAKLEDVLFEGIENQEAKNFPLAFLEAIPVGVTLDHVRWQFCLFLMQENLALISALPLPPHVKQEVTRVTQAAFALHEEAIKTNVWNESAAWAVEVDARAVALSATGPAEAATWSAAWAATWSAWSAESATGSAVLSAAWSAAWSAEAVARSVTRSAVWTAEAISWPATRTVDGAAAYKKYTNHLFFLL